MKGAKVVDDILGVCNDFLLKFLKEMDPPIDQEHIFRGLQNDMALPADATDYILMTLSDTKRIGTNITGASCSEDSKLGTASLREYIVDVDFCHSTDSIARERSEVIETLGRSFFATDFFQEQGLSFLYAKDVKFLPFVDEMKQYIFRYRVSLHLSKWTEVKIPQEYFDQIKFQIENVDVHHEPKNE